MSLADDLLALAKKMVNYKKNDVLDARLRRAVSTAYYALFHMLVEKGSAKIVAHTGIRKLVSRSYVHGGMYNAAKSFVSGVGGLPQHYKSLFGVVVVPQEVVRVAKAFVELQEARHEADYDPGKAVTRSEAQGLVSQADSAFRDWNAATSVAANADMCELFLTSLLLSDRWKK